MKTSRLFGLLFAAGSLLALFQNCETHKKFSNSDSSLQAANNGNGVPYEGKIYASDATCVSGNPVGRIKYISPGSALLVEDQCQVLAPAQPLTAADFSLDSADPTRLHYGVRPFHLEPPPANKVAYGQGTQVWNNNPANSVSSTPLPAPTAAGDLVVCSILYNSPNGVAQINSASDNLGNTFKRAVGPTSGARSFGVAGFTGEVWYAEGVSGGSGLSVTAVFSETIPSSQAIFCYEYSGIATSNALDQTSSGWRDTAGPIDMPAVNTNASNELIFVAQFGNVSVTDPSYSIRYSSGDGNEDKFVTTAGSYTAPLNVVTSGEGFVLTFRAQ